jgi:Cu/Ag efflux protein CusF
MIRRFRAPVVGLLVVAAAFAAAAPSQAAVSARGTVVHRNARTHSFVVAASSGRLTKIRSRHLARLGRTVRVTGRRMRDGSIAASRIRSGATHRRARLRGTVTYANRRSGRFTVSSAAGSIAVRRGSHSRVRAASDDVPAPGQQVVVSVTVQPGGVLEEDGVDELGVDHEVEIEGVVKSVDLNAHTANVSASDDDDASLGEITVTFPETFDVSQLKVGNQIEIKATRQADGSFVLSKMETDDENDLADEADGDNHQQGDQQGDQQDNGDNNGDGENSSSGGDE